MLGLGLRGVVVPLVCSNHDESVGCRVCLRPTPRTPLSPPLTPSVPASSPAMDTKLQTPYILQLINALKRCKLRARLAEARSRMQASFPLSETLWMEWINDSMAHITSAEDAQALKQLFQRATQDYVSVHIWESYLQ